MGPSLLGMGGVLSKREESRERGDNRGWKGKSLLFTPSLFSLILRETRTPWTTKDLGKLSLPRSKVLPVPLNLREASRSKGFGVNQA
jgi:hypothetical protein